MNELNRTGRENPRVLVATIYRLTWRDVQNTEVRILRSGLFENLESR